jgi:hypothetical protein
MAGCSHRCGMDITRNIPANNNMAEKKLSVIILNAKMFCTMAQRIISNEVLWFHYVIWSRTVP